MSNDDAVSIIIEQLADYGGYQKSTSTARMVCCPFHDENTPSCGINMDITSGIPLGFFNCFGCPAKGPWNMFAEKAGLQLVKEWQTKFDGGDMINTFELDSMLLPSTGTVQEQMEKILRNKEIFAWPERKTWRTFKGDVVNKVEGYTFIDRYEDELMLALPVIIKGRVKGVVKARIKKKKGVLSYVTTKGAWIKRYGLFPYSVVKAMHPNYIVLVEGPRDALRLLVEGIPALAVLGAKTFSENKALLVTSIGADHVYIMPDNDRGGRIMYSGISKHLKDICAHSKIALPSKEDVGPLDPCALDRTTMNAVKKFLIKKHGKQPVF